MAGEDAADHIGSHAGGGGGAEGAETKPADGWAKSDRHQRLEGGVQLFVLLIEMVIKQGDGVVNGAVAGQQIIKIAVSRAISGGGEGGDEEVAFPAIGAPMEFT